MQMIYSQEAKAFLSHDTNASKTKRPLLPVFLAKGSKLIAQADETGLQKGIATQVMLHVESGHAKILKMLRPFMFQATDEVYAGRVRIPANVTGHSGDRDQFAHGLHAGTGFVL